VAVHLGQAWLRLALRGRRFPVNVRPAETVLQPDGALVLTGGPFATLPAESQARLAAYLVAAAAGDLDEACDLLLEEMASAPKGAAKEVVRRALRQVIPGHDAGGEAPDRADGPDEYLFAHLRCARAEGRRPRAHLVGFVRGLAGLKSIGQRLSPGGEVLQDALAGLRIETILCRFRDALTLRAVRERGPDCAALLLGLPQFLDQLLALPGGPGRGRAWQDPAAGRQERLPARRNWPTALALAAGVLWLYQQAPATAAGPAGGGLAWGVLAAAGAVVLLERLTGPR
jgi:hypothetical protein